MNNQNLPPVVTVESLKESHGADGETLYHRIASIGGFGDFRQGNFIGGLPPLDISPLDAETKTQIAEVLKKQPAAAQQSKTNNNEENK